MAQLTAQQKISLLLDQTTFLLEKQQEALEESKAIYDDLLALAKAKFSKETNAEEKKYLQEICELLEQQAEYLTTSMMDDVDFLEQQRDSLTDVKKNVVDADKLQELVEILMEGEEEVLDLETFKSEVLSEAKQSKEHLKTMVIDFKDALKEGNNKEIKLYLQALLEEEASEDEGHDDHEDAEEDCGSCKGCGTGDGCGASDDDDEDYDDEDEDYEEEEDEDFEEEEDEEWVEEKPSNSKKSCACGKKESCGCGNGSCGKRKGDVFDLFDDLDEPNA